MGVTNIYLARHGETEYNKCDQIQGRGIDISLNDTGQRQARAIADHLEDDNITRIFSSSLKRSRETAQIIADDYGIRVSSYPDLDEMNFGIYEGQAASEIESELHDLHETWRSGNVNYASEEGESPATVLKRADGKMQSIIRQHSAQNLLFILHGRLIRIILSHWLQYGLSNMHRVPHSNGALYHIQWDGQLFEPIYLNRTKHLER